MKRAVVLLLLLVLAAPAYAWQPPSGGPSKMAKRVLDSLAEPTKVAIPRDIEERSRSGEETITTMSVDRYVPPAPNPQPGCWEVQLTALSDADHARDLAAQESSRLRFPVRVVVENGMAKLRAGGDCLIYNDAIKLRDSVRDSGYSGAFVIRQTGGSGS